MEVSVGRGIFQPSPNFTHIFQIKAGDGSDSGAPIITITPRAGSPETLQIIFTPSSGGSGGGVKTSANLSGFKGQWIEAYVKTLYTDTGTFEIMLTRFSDGTPLLAWSSNNIDMWRGDATFNRPKWGIYRSLNSSSYLRDERVLFADFCIAEGTNTCMGETLPLVLSAAPGTRSVMPGSTVQYDINVESTLGATGGVSLVVSGLPLNTSASFDPATVTHSGTSLLTVQTSLDTPPGSYPLTITGTASTTTNTTTATLLVTTKVDVRPESLVAHLTFDDGAANDSSGHGNHGTLFNGASVVDDVDRGKVLNLDGTDDYVDLGTDASLDLSDDGKATITAWVKMAASKNHNSIVTKGEWKDAYSLLIKGDAGDLLWTGNDTSVFSSSSIVPDMWTHVAVVIEGNLATFYIDGQVDGASGQDRGGPIDNNALDHTELGREDRSDDGTDARWYFNGRLDDVRLYEAALTQAEIQNIINPPAPPVSSAMSWDGSVLVLSWTGGQGPYQVQIKTNLYDQAWQNLGGPTSSNSMILTLSNHAEFFRIQRQ